MFSTDGQGNPVTATVDENGLKTALGNAFASIPKPGPGEVAAQVKCTGKPPIFLSNNLAVAEANCLLTQGKGKTMLRKQWIQNSVWTRETTGWRVRGFSASGLGSLLPH